MRNNGFTKGLITGTIIGATVSMMANSADSKKGKMFKRKTNNFMRIMANIIEDIMDIRG